MKRYDIDALSSSTGEWWNATWRMVERDDGDWVKAEEAEKVEHENVALERRLRAVTQTLAEELRVEGPMSAEEAAKQAVDELRCTHGELQEAEDWNDTLRKQRVEIDRSIGDSIDALSAAAGTHRAASIGDAVQGAVDAIRKLKETAEQDAAENRFLRRQLEAQYRGVRQELDRNISNAIDTLSVAAEVDMPSYIDDAAQAAANMIYRLKDANRKLFREEREEKFRLLLEELEVVAGNPKLLSELMRVNADELAKAVARRINEILEGDDE